MADSPPTPNFFIIGAGGSGTTSLYYYLRQHPDVFMPVVKEPCFFAPEVLQLPNVSPDSVVSSWSEYQKLFAPAGDATAIGEASVAYLASKRAPTLLTQRFPEARIMAILRDPAERLFARYGAARAAGVASDFRRWVDAELKREAAGKFQVGNVHAGRYATHLQRWFGCVEPERRMVLLHDDLRDDPHQTMRQVFAFLGVDPDWTVELGTRHNATHHVRWPLLRRLPRVVQRRLGQLTPAGLRRWFRSAPPPLPSAEEQTWAAELYAPEVEALARLIDRDLSAWWR